jgi:hypothetical protein
VAGQWSLLFELDGWTPADISTYDDYYFPGALPPTPTGISVDGAAITSNDGDGQAEVELDIEVL